MQTICLKHIEQVYQLLNEHLKLGISIHPAGEWLLDNLYIIEETVKHVEIPISIVECGFLSNPEEEKQLLEDEYQNKLAWGIYNGITDYFCTE